MLGTKSFSESYSYRKNDGALDHIDTATGDTVSYGYDALKRVNSVTTKNSAGQTLLTQSNTFQSLDSTRTSSRLSTYTVKGANQQTIVGNRYSYDLNGNITKIEEANGSGYRVIAEYTYDWMDQLLTETRYTYNGTAKTTTVVAYGTDTAGNLREITTKVNGTQTNKISYTYGDSTWADKLTAVKINNADPVTISYSGDALNPQNWYNGTAYTNLTWTQGRRLSSLKKGNQTYSYEYDMSGVRSVKIVDGWKHEYVTQNGKVVRDKVTDASTGAFQYVLEFGYDASGRPLTLRWYYNEAETWYNAYYYICNAQGDVVKLVSDSGATIAAYSYDAWGTLLSIQGESNGDAFIAYANPLRYRGYYYDTETGFYYLQSRYYDPAVKRFLNADSYGSTGQGFLGYNMFAYCGNNPVNGYDSTGHFFEWIGDFARLIFGIASGAIPKTGVNNFSDGGSEKRYAQFLAKRTNPNLGHEMTLYSCTVTHGDVFIVDNESRKTDAHKANVAASGLAQGTTTIGGLLVGAGKGAKAGGTVGGIIGAGVGAVGGFFVGLFFSNMVSDSEIDRYPTLQNGYYREYTVSKIYYSSEVQFYPLGGGAYNLGRWVEVHRWTFAIGCNDYLESWCSEPISYTVSRRFVQGT